MAYRDFNNLSRRRASDKVLRDKTLNIDTNSKHDGYQRGLALMVIDFLIKSIFGYCCYNQSYFKPAFFGNWKTKSTLIC